MIANTEILVKIDPVFADLFGWICQFFLNFLAQVFQKFQFLPS